MKYHLKNPLWVTNPNVAKKRFEKELRERLEELKRTRPPKDSAYWQIKEILDEDYVLATG